MQKKENHSGELDKKLAAVCGLYCEACTLFIATKEDPARLKGLKDLKKFQSERPHRIELWDDLKCRKCGEEPSCGYVAKHKQAIEQCLKNL